MLSINIYDKTRLDFVRHTSIRGLAQLLREIGISGCSEVK